MQSYGNEEAEDLNNENEEFFKNQRSKDSF
jgi:hypothetical protein